VYTFLSEKWYFDNLYNKVFEVPVYWLARISWRWLDRKVIDNLVNSIARGVGNASDDLRPVESGYVRTYALSLVVGVVLLLVLAIGQR
jgi:NADH-quinone oxidoreductase subunit L